MLIDIAITVILSICAPRVYTVNTAETILLKKAVVASHEYTRQKQRDVIAEAILYTMLEEHEFLGF